MSPTEPDEHANLIADVFARNCTSRDLLADVAGKWAVLALLALADDGFRFNALRRRVQGVSEKMLAQTLQTLERDGLVARDVVSAIPPRVEYALTPLGSRVAAQVRGLVELLEESVSEVAAARREYDARQVPVNAGRAPSAVRATSRSGELGRGSPGTTQAELSEARP